MDFLTFMLSVLFVWTLIRALLSASKTCGGKLPPGPIPLPVVGNLLKLGNKPHKSLADLAKTYGPIMTLQLGQTTTVVFSSATLAQEVLQKQDLSFSNRFIPDAVRTHGHDQRSMAWLPVSTRWRILRKICNSFIFTSQRLDENRHLREQKVSDLLARVAESSRAGAGVDIGKLAFMTSLNLLSNTVFSTDFASEMGSGTTTMKEVVRELMEEAGKPNLADYFPSLKRIDPQGIRRRLTAQFSKLFEIFGEMIDRRVEWRKQQQSSADSTTSDVLDVLLNFIEHNTGMEESSIDRTDVQHLLMDLFVAGTDTTSSTVEWAMAELLRKPETLSRIRAELEQTIGKGNRVEEADIGRLPYLQAVVKETLRLHPAGPLLVPRRVQKDVEVIGFTVPAGAQVLVNAWAIARDPEIWPNPECFTPERFLGSDVDVRGHNFELIPFGAGRRKCPGLPLATRMVHLMLGSLVHAFEWKIEDCDDGVVAMDMDDKFGLSLQKAQPLRAVPIQW